MSTLKLKYTPIVVFLAIGICLLPYFFMRDYDFQTYLYRALVFLVISCPCALVISIPLGYFGGIGAASKHGILIKGGNYLDALSKVKHVVMDKTGTLTEGVFQVQTVHIKMEEQLILDQLNMLESHSSHPVATAIHQYVGKLNPEIKFSHVEEVAGMGLKGLIEGQVFLAGNEKLLKQYNIPVASVKESGTHIFVAYNDEYRGFVTISDKLKVNAAKAVTQLQQMNIETTMLSGDQNSVVQEIAQKLGIKNAYGSLLPQDKVTQFEKISNKESKTAFVGDGINDAPVLALSDVGIAMGGLGSDAAIETADVVIQDDNPAKIPMAIKIGKMTQNIIWQNIILAFVVKAIVLVLGAGGIANMWEAVFADVGVAFLAILNAIRIQKHSFSK